MTVETVRRLECCARLGREERAMQNPIKAFGRSFRPMVSDTRVRNRGDVEKEVARRTVMRVATGNIRLQRGQYVTKENTDQRWEKVKNHRFADE